MKMLYGCPFEKIHFLPKIDTNSGFWRDWDTLSKKFNNGTFMALQMKVFNLKIFQIVWCCFQFRFLCFSINGTFFTPYYDYPLSLIVLPIGNPKSLHKLIPLWASPVWIRKSVNNRLCLKSINLQYDMLVRWADGTNDLSTKRLMFQLSFFFVESCKTLCINLSIYFFI